MALPQIDTPRYQFKLHRAGQSYATTIDLPNEVDEQQALANLDAFVAIFSQQVEAVSLYHYPSDATLKTVRLAVQGG